MRGFRILAAAAFCAAQCAFSTAMAGGNDLGELFASTNAWRQSADAFLAAHGGRGGFRAGDAKKTQANCMQRGAFTWHGLEVWEARVYFATDCVQRVELSLYNRGDDKSGGLGKKDLDRLLADIRAKIPGKSRRTESSKPKRGSVVHEQKWPTLEPSVELSWGETGTRASDTQTDFVRVVLQSASTGASARTKKVGGIRQARANVRKNDEGDVWIDNVPMVDQGDKGYCAAATAERVLRYYGFTIDEHEIAQAAGTTAEGGTSSDAMRETVKKAASKCRLGYNDIVAMVDKPEREIKDYNRSAKKLKKPEISFNQFLRGNTFMIGDMIQAMDRDVLHDMRSRDSRAKKFEKTVREQVDKGNPVFWSVQLGIYAEPGLPQQGGGHMRLIIGYNKKKNEILYTDSWGAGHELKRMPADWAFTITNDAFFLRPL